MEIMIQILFDFIHLAQIEFPEMIFDQFHKAVRERGIFDIGEKIGATQM